MPGQFEQAIQAEQPDTDINDIALAVRNHHDNLRNRQRGHHVSGYGSDGGTLSDGEIEDARRRLPRRGHRSPETEA